MYADIITDLADRETYPGELGGAKLKTTKAVANRTQIKATLSQKPAKTISKPSTAPSKWIG